MKHSLISRFNMHVNRLLKKICWQKLIPLFVAIASFFVQYYWDWVVFSIRLIGKFLRSLFNLYVAFETIHPVAAGLVLALLVYLVTVRIKNRLLKLVSEHDKKAALRNQFEHSYSLIADTMLPNMEDMAEKNKTDINISIDRYIQPPLEYVSETLKGNQVPTFSPDDSYQDVIFGGSKRINYIVAITAENPNLFLNPTIGFYMSNCYAASLIRHVNDYFQKSNFQSGTIPQLRVENKEKLQAEIESKRRNIIDLLKNKNETEGFEFIRFFIYDKDQNDCCRKAVLPSLKASQDLFRTYSFYIRREKLESNLKNRDEWNKFRRINEQIWNLYQVYCEDFQDAKTVLERRIDDTTPEFLFIFYEDGIGIHTYIAGHYWPLTISFSAEQEDQTRSGEQSDTIKVTDSIKELIKILAEYVSQDELGGQMGLEDSETNKKNAFINWGWAPKTTGSATADANTPKDTGPSSPTLTDKPATRS